jgi:8-oxo-dGTP pyrophosphatase MutT (NUDIX family)
MTDPKTPSAPSTSDPEGIPAATVVIFRNNAAGGPPEILMQIRSRTMTFAGGMAVFPGGRVDEADFALADTLAPQSDDERGDIANRIAAIRETLEETGLVIGVSNKVDAETAKAAREHLLEVKTLAGVLAAFEWSLDLAQLTPFARWFPKNEPITRVYDTRFYLADLGTGAVDIEADLGETTKLFWASAQGALDAADKGEIKVIFPTRRNLERLALFANFDEAKAQAEAIPVKTIVPQVDTVDGQPMLTIIKDAGYPVTAELLDSVKRG